MRHGEAEIMSPTGKDYDRALSQKGCLQVTEIGKILKQNVDFPMVVLCSPALRTRQTLEALNFDKPIKTEFHKKLYQGSVVDYIAILARAFIIGVPLLLIGHNPTVSSMVSILRRPDDLSVRFSKLLKPAGLAVFDFPENIKQNFLGKGHLISILQP